MPIPPVREGTWRRIVEFAMFSGESSIPFSALIPRVFHASHRAGSPSFMKSRHLLLLPLIAPLTHADAVPHPLSDPSNNGGWVLNASVSDEFDGDSLDLSKWLNLGLDGNYQGEWKGRAPSQFNPANVKVGGGHLTITSKWDPNFEFSDTTFTNGMKYGETAPVTTGCIITKARFRFGYMEMRCKAAAGPISSSFWTTGEGGEIDVFEHFGHNPNNPNAAFRYHTSFHDWRKGSPTIGKRIWTHDHVMDFRVTDDFHVYGLEWHEDGLIIHLDGRLVNCIPKAQIGDNWVASNEQKVWIDSETFDWEVKPHLLKAADFGDGLHFVVDYCRIWQRPDTAFECEPRTNLLKNPDFQAGLESWDATAAVLTEDGHAALLDKSGIVSQTVSVKPDTTYIFSGSMKTGDTTDPKAWLICDMGVKDFGKDKVDTHFFLPALQRKSVQFTTGPDASTAVVYFENSHKGRKIIVDDFQLVEAPAP